MTSPGTPSENPQTPLLTVDEVAKLLRLAPKTVYRYLSQGTLPSVRFGGSVRIPQDQLAAFLRQRGAEEGVAVPTLQASAPPAVKAKCASCQRLLPQPMLTAVCSASGCDAPLCVDCQAQWPDLRCPRHRPTLEQRLALAKAGGRQPVLAPEAALWEHTFLERFSGLMEQLGSYPHPLGGAALSRADAQRSEEQWWASNLPLVVQGGPMPRAASVVYRFPGAKDGKAKWAVAAGVLARVDRFARDGFDTDPVTPDLWQEWLLRFAEQAGLEQRVWIVGIASPTGWSPEIVAAITGSAQQRPFYDRWVAVALIEERGGEPRVWTNPADGRLKPYLHLFLGRLPEETAAQVRAFVRRQLSEGASGVSAQQAQEACQVDASLVQAVFHLLEREGAGITQWVEGFGLVLFRA